VKGRHAGGRHDGTRHEADRWHAHMIRAIYGLLPTGPVPTLQPARRVLRYSTLRRWTVGAALGFSAKCVPTLFSKHEAKVINVLRPRLPRQDRYVFSNLVVEPFRRATN